MKTNKTTLKNIH